MLAVGVKGAFGVRPTLHAEPLTEASASVLESRQRVLAQLPYHCSAPICAAARVPISLSAAVQPGDIHHSGCRP